MRYYRNDRCSENNAEGRVTLQAIAQARGEDGSARP